MRDLGTSLADIAAFMQEIEIQQGWVTQKHDGRGIERLRRLAMQLEEPVKRSDKDVSCLRWYPSLSIVDITCMVGFSLSYLVACLLGSSMTDDGYDAFNITDGILLPCRRMVLFIPLQCSSIVITSISSVRCIDSCTIFVCTTTQVVLLPFRTAPSPMHIFYPSC